MHALNEFTLRRARTLAEAAAWLGGQGGARIVAGGTDLLPNLRRGIEQPGVLIDLSGVAGFDAIEHADGALVLGAGVTLAALARDAAIAATWPAVAQAALGAAGPAHRAAATLGGNLCQDTRCVFYNQSVWWRQSNDYCLKRGGTVCHVATHGKHCHAAFCGDMAPALLVLGAQVELCDAQGSRWLPLAELYCDDGAAHLALRPGELLARVRVPRPAAGTVCGYRKARVRGSIDFPLAGVAISLALRNRAVESLAIALSGTNSRPIVLAGTAEFAGEIVGDALAGKIGKLVQQQASPMRSTVTPSNYRRQVAAALARRLLFELAGAAASGAA